MKLLSTSPRLTLCFKSAQKSKNLILETQQILKLALPTIEDFLLEKMKLYSKGVIHVRLNFILCGKNKIQRLNEKYLNKKKVTDVLSFPVHTSVRKLKCWNGPLELGDLFVCREVAQRQAQKFQMTYSQEIVHLFIHGFLHLLGYDHEKNKKEEILMFSLEDWFIKRIDIRRNKKGKLKRR